MTRSVRRIPYSAPRMAGFVVAYAVAFALWIVSAERHPWVLGLSILAVTVWLLVAGMERQRDRRERRERARQQRIRFERRRAALAHSRPDDRIRAVH